MLVSSVIKRYTNEYGGPINCIMTPTQDKKFSFFIKKVLPQGSHILSLEGSVFADRPPDIIICNNKINDIEKCGKISYFFHCPILVVYHEPRPSFVEKDIVDHQSKSIYTIALNSHINKSWWNKANSVMGYDAENPDNIEQWYSAIYQISRLPFSIRGLEEMAREKEEEKNNNEQ